MKKHITWSNIVLGLTCLIISVSIRFFFIYGLNYVNTPNVWLISGFIALISKLGIKGIVDNLMEQGLLELLEQIWVLPKREDLVLKMDGTGAGGDQNPSDSSQEVPSEGGGSKDVPSEGSSSKEVSSKGDGSENYSSSEEDFSDTEDMLRKVR